MILIPVKNLFTAKQRLAGILDQPSRTELAQAMLHDVVAEIARWPGRPECSLVTGDPFAVELADKYGFEVIPDPANPGETGAIEMATEFCVAHGANYTLVVPADIPLIEFAELKQILARAPEEGAVLAPAYDGRGTNAAFRRPANMFPLRFGNDSFEPHLAAARATGKECVVLNLPGLAVDVDNPADVEDVLRHPGETRTQRLLRSWNMKGIVLASSAEER